MRSTEEKQTETRKGNKEYMYFRNAIIFLCLVIVIWGGLQLATVKIPIIKEYLPDFLFAKQEYAILQNTSYRYPNSSSGTFGNASNVNASDNIYATSTIVNNTIISANFSFLSNEGGAIPNNSMTYIQGFDVRVEGKTSCLTGIYKINVSLSKDRGATYYTYVDTINSVHMISYDSSGVDADTSWEALVGFDTDSYKYSLGADATSQPVLNGKMPQWNFTDISNANFRAKIVVNSKCTGTLSIDGIKIRIGYTNPPANNLTNTDLVDYIIDHPSISDVTPVINISNVQLYIPFDWERSPTVPNLIADYHPNSLEHYNANKAPVVNYTCGLFGMGACFNSTNSILFNRGDDGIFNSSWTVNVWAFPNATVSGRQIYDSTNHFPSYRNTGKFEFRLFNTTDTTSTPQICVDPNDYSKSSWEMWSVTYNITNKAVKLYRNGTLVNGTCTAIGDWVPNWQNLRIGESRSGLSAGFFKGSMDEFMLIRSELNSTHILDLYNNQSKIFYPRAEQVFSNLNISNNNTLNFSIGAVIPQGSSINISIGNLSGGSYVYGREYVLTSLDTLGTSNNINVSNGQNFSIKLIYYSDQQRVAVTNRTYVLNSYISGADGCAYTSGNWNLNCSLNCNITTNIIINTGSNISIFGNGNVTFNANITLSSTSNTLFGDVAGSCTVL